MSYCRWSSDDLCDIYCYASAGGWEIHVAGSRLVFAEPLPPAVPFEDTEAWIARHLKVTEQVEGADRVPIGLPHDGESYTEPDAGSAADRLEALAAAGYNVPEYAIGALREEAAEAS